MLVGDSQPRQQVSAAPSTCEHLLRAEIAGREPCLPCTVVVRAGSLFLLSCSSNTSCHLSPESKYFHAYQQLVIDVKSVNLLAKFMLYLPELDIRQQSASIMSSQLTESSGRAHVTIHGILIIVIYLFCPIKKHFFFLPGDFLIMELICHFYHYKILLRDIVQIYSPQCEEKKGDKEKIVKKSFAPHLCCFLKSLLGV